MPKRIKEGATRATTPRSSRVTWAPGSRPARSAALTAPASFSLLAPAYAHKYGVDPTEMKDVLTRIADVSPERLYLTREDQKTFVDVNEEGTEAAAVTNVGVSLTSAPAPFRGGRGRCMRR